MIKSHLYKLVTREFKPKDTVIDVNGVKIGGKEVIVIGGPCAVEDEEQTITIARNVKKSGADGLLIEVHHKPEIAKSDGQQSLNLVEFNNLMQELKTVSKAVGRDL